MRLKSPISLETLRHMRDQVGRRISACQLKDSAPLACISCVIQSRLNGLSVCALSDGELGILRFLDSPAGGTTHTGIARRSRIKSPDTYEIQVISRNRFFKDPCKKNLWIDDLSP